MVVPRGAGGVDASVGSHCGIQRLVAEQLFNSLICTGLGVEHGPRAEMAELVRREFDPNPLAQGFPDQQRHALGMLGRSIDVDEQPFGLAADDPWRDAVGVVQQHPGEFRRQVKGKIPAVLYFRRRDFKGRDSTAALADEQVRAETE